MVFAAGYTSPLHGHGRKPCLIEKEHWSFCISAAYLALELTDFERVVWVGLTLREPALLQTAIHIDTLL